MSGIKDFLKRGRRVIVDTHILVAAAEAERNEEPNDALQLILKIIKDCPKIIFSELQRDEAHPFLRRIGFRFPQQKAKFFQKLEGGQKLLKLEERRMRSLPAEAEEVLVGPMKDDRHLYCAAVQYDGVVITRDHHLLEHRHAIKEATKVTTLSLEEALAG